MSEHQEPSDVDKEAASWDARLRRPHASPRTRIAFQQWRDASPDNAETWTRLEEGLSALRAQAHLPELRALRDEARMGVRRTRSRRWTGAIAAVAATVVLAIGGALTLTGDGSMLRAELLAVIQGGEVYQTALNERTKVTLEDGSVVTLDSDSRLIAHIRHTRRDLRLLTGRALFNVAKDPHRPFIVRAGDRTVTALGTVFDVGLSERDRVKVTLLEGKVAVRSLPVHGVAPEVQILKPRQQFVETRARPTIEEVDIDKVVSWTEGVIIFEDEPLESAVVEMNRYSRSKIVVTDPAIGQLRINGMFRAGNQTGFVGALQATLPVVVHADDSRILVSAG